MKEIIIDEKTTLFDIVYQFLNAIKNNQVVFCNFRGVNLQSDKILNYFTDLITVDYTLNPKDQITYFNKYQNGIERIIIDFIRKINNWFDEGKKIIIEEKHLLWEECVMKRSIDLFRGQDIELALNIMRLIDEFDSLDEAVSVFNKSLAHNSCLQEMVKGIILEFSKQGPEFFLKVTPNISKGAKEFVDMKLTENIKLNHQKIKK